ncbi:MAG: prepilin-type N-terminal cleavage/methylation domain-containing protein [Proteobacteria bacterium]|nr:prepilin-type N-terminal cleavage/methylation domain-containing protein [Pseudomonadota bacterium]MBU4472502.1 prepilin-type N-terminal cleavage/methylation domain-containing protein [Pseudomonadota bacterium]MCG2751328.1 prepilin-type N-terminal cleavage/methylation domain-containing protein [Desulfobacteraceae bacterium]
MTVQKKSVSKRLSNKGFSLVELLVAMTIFALVTTAIWSNFNSQNTIYRAQEQSAKIQQNMRASMYVMEKELRMAGYDPDSIGYGVDNIKNNILRFTYDDGSGGYASVAYALVGSQLRRVIKFNEDVAGADLNDEKYILAENIYDSGSVDGFYLAYAFDDNGDGELDVSPNGHIIWAVDTNNDDELDLRLDTNDDGAISLADDTGNDNIIDGNALASPVAMANIRAVRIWILGQAEKTDMNYHDGNRYIVGRNIITPDDRIRRRLLTTIVKCRNLGV